MIFPRFIADEISSYIDTHEAVIVTGMRRTGKSTILKLFFDDIVSDNKIFLDLENPLNRKYFEEESYETVRAAFEFLGLILLKRFIFLSTRYSLPSHSRQ